MMKKIIVILCLFFICLTFVFAADTKPVEDIKTTTEEEKISEDIKTFEREVREFFIDPPVNQFGLGIFFGSYFTSKISEISTSPTPPHPELPVLLDGNLGLSLDFTHSNIKNKFGFRWNLDIGGSPMRRALHLGTNFNWIFLKLRFDSSHTRSTHILDLSLGLGLNSELFLNQKIYLLDPFLQFGISFSFYNHWTVFTVGGAGWNFPFVPSNYEVSDFRIYCFGKVGIRYNF